MQHAIQYNTICQIKGLNLVNDYLTKVLYVVPIDTNSSLPICIKELVSILNNPKDRLNSESESV